jgi:hypothetical protein
MRTDPEQAERFFGNRMVYGAGTWLGRGEPIVLGFDGSDVDDWSVLRAQTQDGYQFTPVYGVDKKPCIWNPAEHRGQVPRLEVDAAIEELFERFSVVRMYADPPDWKTEIDGWSAKHGEKVVLRWETYRITQMHAALKRMHSDVTKDATTFTHDGDAVMAVHIRNARKLARAGQKYILGKPSQTQKIDGAMSAALCNEAAGDVTAAGLWARPAAEYAYSA